MSKITYCMVHLNRLKLLQKAIRHHSPHVDRTIVIDGGSKDGSIEWLNSQECKDLKVECYVHPWKDDPPGQRNLYLDYARNDDWILSTDDDEYLEEVAIWRLRSLAKKCDDAGVTCLRFNAHDIQVNEKGEVWENRSNYWNPLIFFKMAPGVRYEGKTHVGLRHKPGKMADSGYRYFHEKSTMDQWYRGARNYWTTAAPASNSVDDTWLDFKKRCEKYKLQFFYEMAALMETGGVPQELVQWFIDHKDSDNTEARSFFNTYLVFMHPELNNGISNRDFLYDPSRPQIKGMHF